MARYHCRATTTHLASWRAREDRRCGGMTGRFGHPLLDVRVRQLAADFTSGSRGAPGLIRDDLSYTLGPGRLVAKYQVDAELAWAGSEMLGGGLMLRAF